MLVQQHKYSENIIIFIETSLALARKVSLKVARTTTRCDFLHFLLILDSQENLNEIAATLKESALYTSPISMR